MFQIQEIILLDLLQRMGFLPSDDNCWKAVSPRQVRKGLSWLNSVITSSLVMSTRRVGKYW